MQHGKSFFSKKLALFFSKVSKKSSKLPLGQQMKFQIIKK